MADYPENCAAEGKSPRRVFSRQRVVRVKPELDLKAVLVVELARKSLDQWAEEVLGKAVQ